MQNFQRSAVSGKAFSNFFLHINLVWPWKYMGWFSKVSQIFMFLVNYLIKSVGAVPQNGCDLYISGSVHGDCDSICKGAAAFCFRTTERMLITLGPLYKPAPHVDEEYILICFPKASTQKTAFHLVERSGWYSTEMSLCLQWPQGNCKITVGTGKGLKRAWYVIEKVCGNPR